jgi:PAS domain S-box-containing protein
LVEIKQLRKRLTICNGCCYRFVTDCWPITYRLKLFFARQSSFVQEQDNHYRFLSDDPSDFFENQPIKTSFEDRHLSFSNTMRGYEEYTLNLEGTILSSNLEAVNVTGYEEWEVIGKSFSMFYSREDQIIRKPEEDLMQACLYGKVFYTGTFKKKKDVSFRAKIRITVIKDESGGHCGYRVVIKDTTHNALYNYRVKRVRDEYLNLFNNSFIGIFKFRLSDSKLLVLNEKAKTLLNVKDPEEITFENLFSDIADYYDFVRRLMERDSEQVETQIEYKGVWLSISCRAFVHQGFAEGIFIDITEKKKQMAELQRLNQEIDKFIYHSSHDMRSPLTTILGLTHLIALEQPNRTIAEYNEMIQSQVQYLDNLLKNLVNITFNKNSPTQELIDFEKEIDIVLRDFRNQYQRIKVDVQIQGEHRLLSDPARIHIILKNLISNAFRFHNPHAEQPFITVRIEQQFRQTIIEIEDNGIGIDEKCVGEIFSMFYKGERGSTGLGLYVVKSMVDKLGGKIEVKSKRWMGSVFRAQLPKSDPH